jgi:ferric-dicitrate binding protein FerR (iron transport regulator)
VRASAARALARRSRTSRRRAIGAAWLARCIGAGELEEGTMRTREQTRATTSVDRAWQLAENTTLRLPRGNQVTMVRVERGTVLVTQAGDRDDHVLEPGDALVLAGRGLAVAWAFTEATISVRVVPRSSRIGSWKRAPASSGSLRAA